MVLTKEEIVKRIEKGNITFMPSLDAFQIQAHSIDLRLGFTFLIPKMWQMTLEGREAMNIDPLKNHGPEHFDVVELEQGQYFDLLPQEYILVATLETMKVPDDLMAILYPRSSTNRKGLAVDLTGIIDSGYEGVLTIPIRNNTRTQTIRLHPGERFCQIIFQMLSRKVKARKSRWHKKDIVDKGKKEKATEMNFIKKGDIRGLKAAFPAK